jgi:hypothetical protein
MFAATALAYAGELCRGQLQVLLELSKTVERRAHSASLVCARILRAREQRRLG